MRIKRILGWLLALIVLASPVVLAWQRQNILDWWRLYNYDPPAEISALADHTTMNDYGQKLFYVHKPELKDKTTFGLACPNHQEETIVLGCYVSNRHIYIFDVTEPRLSGIKEVTAAHEMLHAAYDRLSDEERSRIDALTASVLDGITNQRLLNIIAAYRAQDPNIVPNELHSILGTEVRELPAELEQYYGKYFTDRSKIVAYAESYEVEFTSRQVAVAAYDQQLAELSGQISGLEQELRLQIQYLDSERGRLDELRSSNPEAYNQQRLAFNDAVNEYNSGVLQIQQLVDDYNDIVVKRNQIASEQADLKNAINSNLPAL